MRKKTKGWSKERRAKQAENCRRTQPWLHATGPQTPEGLAAIKTNALKHGLWSAEMEALRAALRQQAAYVRAVRDLLGTRQD